MGCFLPGKRQAWFRCGCIPAEVTRSGFSLHPGECLFWEMVGMAGAAGELRCAQCGSAFPSESRRTASRLCRKRWGEFLIFLRCEIWNRIRNCCKMRILQQFLFVGFRFGCPVFWLPAPRRPAWSVRAKVSCPEHRRADSQHRWQEASKES